MRFIHDKKKYFIFDLKSNRKATLGDRNKPNWTNVSILELQANTPTLVWLKDVELPILLFKQVFTNKDNSTGVRYLVSNNLDLTSNDFISIYQNGGVLKNTIRVLNKMFAWRNLQREQLKLKRHMSLLH